MHIGSLFATANEELTSDTKNDHSIIIHEIVATWINKT